MEIKIIDRHDLVQTNRNALDAAISKVYKYFGSDTKDKYAMIAVLEKQSDGWLCFHLLMNTDQNFVFTEKSMLIVMIQRTPTSEFEFHS